MSWGLGADVRNNGLDGRSCEGGVPGLAGNPVVAGSTWNASRRRTVGSTSKAQAGTRRACSRQPGWGRFHVEHISSAHGGPHKAREMVRDGQEPGLSTIPWTPQVNARGVGVPTSGLPPSGSSSACCFMRPGISLGAACSRNRPSGTTRTDSRAPASLGSGPSEPRGQVAAAEPCGSWKDVATPLWVGDATLAARARREVALQTDPHPGRVALLQRHFCASCTRMRLEASAGWTRADTISTAPSHSAFHVERWARFVQSPVLVHSAV